jgi:hypothetical protein
MVHRPRRAYTAVLASKFFLLFFFLLAKSHYGGNNKKGGRPKKMLKAPSGAAVLLSASVKIFFVSSMRDFYEVIKKNVRYWYWFHSCDFKKLLFNYLPFTW